MQYLNLYRIGKLVLLTVFSVLIISAVAVRSTRSVHAEDVANDSFTTIVEGSTQESTTQQSVDSTATDTITEVAPPQEQSSEPASIEESNTSSNLFCSNNCCVSSLKM